MNSARTWWRKANNLEIAIPGAKGFPQNNVVTAKIIRGDQSSILVHPLLGLARKFTVVKPINSIFRNRAITPRQVWLFQNLTRRVSFTVRFEKNLSRLGKVL